MFEQEIIRTDSPEMAKMVRIQERINEIHMEDIQNTNLFFNAVVQYLAYLVAVAAKEECDIKEITVNVAKMLAELSKIQFENFKEKEMK